MIPLRLCVLALVLSCSHADDFHGETMDDDGWIAHISLGGGVRTLPDEWQGLDQLALLDFGYDLRRSTWPVHLALTLSGATGSAEADDGRDFDVTLFELGAGVGRYERFGPLELGYAVLATVSSARLSSSRYDDNDAALGVAGQVQVLYGWRDRWFSGLRARYHVSSDIELILADEASVDGLALALVLGGRF